MNRVYKRVNKGAYIQHGTKPTVLLSLISIIQTWSKVIIIARGYLYEGILLSEEAEYMYLHTYL
jgi:hypothetical protein